jgi:hypothetical protein
VDRHGVIAKPAAIDAPAVTPMAYEHTVVRAADRNLDPVGAFVSLL